MKKQDTNEGFISRWSKRKQAVAAGEEMQEPSLDEAISDDVPNEISEERAAELKANQLAAEAIDMERLEYDSDFSAFFKDGVPLLLKQKAMRILWRTHPVLANVDGLCDYDENFADPSLILDKYASAYRVGKGYAFEDTADEGEEEVAAAEASDESEIVASEEQEPPAPIDAHVEPPTDLNDEGIEEDTPKREHVSLRQRLELDS